MMIFLNPFPLSNALVIIPVVTLPAVSRARKCIRSISAYVSITSGSSGSQFVPGSVGKLAGG